MKPYYTPHSAQAIIHSAANRRFRVVCTGRRFGKTLFLAGELMDLGGHRKGGTCRDEMRPRNIRFLKTRSLVL